MSRARVLRRIRAHRLDRAGTESAALLATDEGWRLSGLARTQYPEGRGVLRYRIECDRRWRTRTAHLQLHMGNLRRSVRIAADDRGRWVTGGMEQGDLRGCTDLDLTATAMTNTLPIRRLELPVGAGAEILAAWITFPDLEIHPIRQVYTRIAEDRYRYEAPHNGFVAEFTVDDVGIVVSYPGYWERIPRGRGRQGGRTPARSRGGLMKT